MKCVFSKKAHSDFVQFYRYIASGNVVAASRVIVQIEKTCDVLLEMPKMGKKSEFVQHSSVRVVPVAKYQNYLIFYKVNHNQLIIIRILHSAQDIPNIFADEE